MNVISRPAILEASQRYPKAARWLESWWRYAKSERWASLHDVQRNFASVDQIGRCLVFDACGNNYRLVVRVSYANAWTNGTLWVKHFLTHAQYDRGAWKKDCD